MAAFVWPDESPASRAYSSFDNSWGSPTAMLNTADLSHELHLPPTRQHGLSVRRHGHRATPLPRTGRSTGRASRCLRLIPTTTSLDTTIQTWMLAMAPAPAQPAASTSLTTRSRAHPAPGTWALPLASSTPRPDSPAFSGDSFGLPSGLAPPFSPPMPFASSLPNERALSSASPIQDQCPHLCPSHQHPLALVLVSAPGIIGPVALVPPDTSHAGDEPLGGDAQSANQPGDEPTHPYSTSAPSRPPAPIATAGKFRRSSTPDEDQASAGEEDPSRKRKHSPELERTTDIAPPLRSRLHPPKQAPSTWQIFFTEYLQNYKVTNPERKLNVSQAAKDGGAAYKALTSDQKEIYKRKARLAKDEYERELAAWQKTLLPRTFGRRTLTDPNAPKKPLSAYFMFLQWIRADPGRVTEVFGDETETTRQSVLAAAKWRTLSDADKKPFLAQAEREKLEYEAARKEYEERTTGISNPNVYGGYMQMNTGDASGGWHHTSAEADGLDHNFGGRRSSSSNGKLAGGAAFGALVFAPSPFDEDTFEPNDMDDVFAIHQWKTE
ncbi:HMG (high mobility group) box protein [Ceratobasidium sp. AG-Ba]|nr:HMG (high mobility group) box protein [Ceratobasidium sp. AG-Ba]